jgi:hypothetical protein
VELKRVKVIKTYVGSMPEHLTTGSNVIFLQSVRRCNLFLPKVPGHA